jgi:signal transduction histidine kinase
MRMSWLRRFGIGDAGWRQFWPRKLLSQMVILVILALVLAQGISLWIVSSAYRTAMVDNSERHIVRQFVSAVILMEQTPPELHRNILRAWRRPGLNYSIQDIEPTDPSRAELTEPVLTEPERRMEQAMIRWLGDEYRGRVRVMLELDERRLQRGEEAAEQESAAERGRRQRPTPLPVKQLMIAVQLQDQRWLVSHMAAPEVAPLAARHTLTFVVVASILVLLVVFWQLRKITRPLSRLAAAANDLGRGKEVAPLQEEGPQDVRDTLIAFNRMNDRLQRFVSDRTQMLAALSHDLRTPMTSMRLRMELMAPSDERDKLLASLDEMQQMSEASLDFVRQSGDVETTRAVDVTALLDSLCEDLRDLGMAVDCAEADKLVLDVRPVSLKRALRNVIENAVKYGGRADVSVLRRDNKGYNNVVIVVSDSGPGIPEDKQASVFEPFVRVEESRSRNTGGMGLGLSIARQVVASHGGEICLFNRQRPETGLTVEIILPCK